MRRALPAAVLAALVLPATATASFTQELGSPYTVGASPYGVVTADFSGDGLPDVLSVNGTQNNSTASVLVRQPAGQFAVSAPVPLGHGSNYATVADFNGDQHPDVAISNFWSDNVSVLLRQPDGSLVNALGSPINVSHHASAVAAGDFDRDGDVDLAVANWGGGLTILLREVGGFVIGPTRVMGVMPRHIAVADFNADGDLDLAVTIMSNETVEVLRGDAGATFAPEGTPIPVGTDPANIIADDINGDGRPDLALASFGASTVTVLLRQGDGFVQEGAPLPVEKGALGIAAGDFNRDGVRDLAVASNTASRVTVLLRTPGGGYVPDSSSPMPTDNNGGAYNLAVADFDADSRQDLAVTNDQTGKVTILLNTTPVAGPPPPPPGPVDADGDGVVSTADCNDANPAIRPGAKEIPGDGIDQNCDNRDARLPLLKRRIRAITATYPSGYMTFTSMSVAPARKGDRLRLTCKGKGCKFKRKAIRVKKNAGKVSLMKHVRGMELRKGAVVQLRVTRAGTIGRVRTWRVRAPKIPKIQDRCAQPGAKKLIRCPRG